MFAQKNRILVKELKKAESVKDCKGLSKILANILQIMRVAPNFELRPDFEKSCALKNMLMVTSDDGELAQIYPNTKAPSDHPPYMVQFIIHH